MKPDVGRKPLSDLRVLVPRGGEWGNSIAAKLRRRGAVPVIAPLINFASAENAQDLITAFDRLQHQVFDWLVVTSATTVDVLASHQVHVPKGTLIAAVGETTSSALQAAGFSVDFASDTDSSVRGLIKEWKPTIPSAKVLVPLSDTPDASLVSGLQGLGFDMEFVTAYRTVGVPVTPEIAREFALGKILGVLITSGSVAHQIQVQLAPLPVGVAVAAIGPKTAFDARAAGITVDVIAEDRTADALVQALVDLVVSRTGDSR